MTTKITDLTAALMTNAVNPVMPTNTASVRPDEKTPGFSDVFDIAIGKISQESTAPVNDVNATKTSNDAKEAFDKSLSKEIDSKDISGKDPINNDNDKTELVAEATEAGNDIVSSVKDKLDVSDEEIVQAMETLGLTVVDLLDPQNVQALCMELKGIDDSISLLMDEDLYANVKMLCNMATEAGEALSEQFGIDKNSFDEIIDDDDLFKEVLNALQEQKGEAATVDPDTGLISQKAVTNDSDATGETVQPSGETEGNAELDADSNTYSAVGETAGYETINVGEESIVKTDSTTVQDSVEQSAQVATDAGTSQETPTVKVTVTKEETQPSNAVSAEEALSKEGQESSLDSVTETLKNEAKSEGANLRGRNEGFENASRFSENTEAVTPTVETVTQTTVNSVGDIVETVTHYSNVDGNEILSQVTESIKVNYTPDMTSMEMQLHPASLGTVNMHISSSNGIVTAHIIVENEAVKAALESQLITLQETFEASGQKVEAVDVSVAGYDLNRGMNSETGNNSQGNSEETFRRSGVRRRINLNDLSADDMEEMSEEEMIAADMMARLGNSVDFMA